jgi:hypothetical protein
VLATGSDRNAGLARLLALAVAVAGFLVTLPLYTGFDRNGTSGMQFVELRALDPALQHQLPPRRRRHLGAVHPAQQLHHAVWWCWPAGR